jgi:hypothetical protein
MTKILKNEKTQITGISEKTGVLIISPPKQFDGEISVRVKQHLKLEGVVQHSIFDTLDSGSGYGGGGEYTFPELVITGSHDPCSVNPFDCGCPFQMNSCTEGQFPEDSDPYNNNDPCSDGNCGGAGAPGGSSGSIPTPLEYIERFLQLNPCEKQWTVMNPNKALTGYSIYRDVERFANEIDSIEVNGGNRDNTKGNAIKHFIWNVLMGCSPDFSYTDVFTVATNHEICDGQILNTQQQYNMDMNNNAVGRSYIEHVKNNGKCNDYRYIVDIAIANQHLLIWFDQ